MSRQQTDKDRAILHLLQTNPSELERILKRSRQTISRRLEEGRLFGVEEVVDVAAKKIADPAIRSRTVSAILSGFFPKVVENSRDRDVARFSRYAITGMHIHAEITSNVAFEEFLRNVLSVESKFVLFVCRPQKEHLQLRRWLENFRRERQERTASFALLPCRLMELAGMQIIAEPWSSEPKLIQLTDDLFVDEASAKRAAQIAGALMDYGLSERACESIEDKEVVKRLIDNLNQSFYDDSEIGRTPPLVVVNSAPRTYESSADDA